MICLVLVCAGFAYAGTKAATEPKPTNDDCLACHSDASMVNGKEVHGDAFKASIHGSMFSCVDCHTDVKSLPHDAGLAKPNLHHLPCRRTEDVRQWRSREGAGCWAMRKLQIAKAATAIFMKSYLPATPSPVPPRVNIPKTCGQCHSQPIPGMAGKPALAYQESVHGKLVAAGNDKAAVCSDCHGEHDIRRAERSHFAGLPRQRAQDLLQVPQRRGRPSSPRAFTARFWPTAIPRLRSARPAMASTPSRPPTTRIRWYRRGIRATLPAPSATTT